MSSQQNRRSALKAMLAASAAPFVFRQHGHTAPTDTLYHAAFGAAGMAGADINSLTASRNLRLVAVADVDLAHGRGPQTIPQRPHLSRLARTARP